jgi:hypothetical protein
MSRKEKIIFEPEEILDLQRLPSKEALVKLNGSNLV